MEDDRRVNAVTDPITKPGQVTAIQRGGINASLDVDRNELTADVNHDVDLLVSAAGPKMRQMPASSIDLGSQLCDHERLYVAASKRWVAGQLVRVDPCQRQRERRVDQLSLRIRRDSLQTIRFPRWKRSHHMGAGKHVPIGVERLAVDVGRSPDGLVWVGSSSTMRGR